MSSPALERILRKSLIILLPRLRFDFKMQIAQLVLRDCGFGSGGAVADSNEQAVFGLIKSQKPLLFDVGAHVGEYTALFKSRFPDGSAHCFEPSRRHFDLLREKSASLSNIELHCCALGSEEGEATLYRPSAVSGLASLTKRRLDHFSIDMEIQEKVQVTTLDRVVEDRGIGHIDLLKIDVEGHELDVLRGAKEMLEAGRIDTIQFEFGGCNLDTRTNLQDFYYLLKEQHRFALFIVTPAGLKAIDAYREAYEQYVTSNFVATRI
jgi:FkbM family methyltransferase